jgi:hypothetical protein
MKYFNNCQTLDQLKAEYRRLTKIHHPDCGGSDEAMKEVNADYTARFEVLKNQHNKTADEYHQTTEAPEDFIEIINQLVKLDGIEIELCGAWLWIGGNTREHKDALKAAGCRWSSNKNLWYWRHPEDGRKWHKGNKSMNQIRSKYGSQMFKGAAEYSGFEQLNGATA